MANNLDFLSHYKIETPPPVKGWWIIGKSNWGQIQFAVYKKPNAFHRIMTKLLLGWDWQNND